MLSLALASVLGFQQTTLTFKSNFEPLGKVVERLSSETRIPMAAFGDIKGYPIYINVKNVAVKDLLQKIADVSGAEWEKKDNDYYLIASQSLRTDQSKAGDADLIKAIDATINQPAPKKKTEADFESIARNAEKNPEQMMKVVGEMMAQMFGADEGTLDLLRIIGSKDLSSIVEGRRVVLSNNPTQMQALMPSKAVTALRAYMKDLAAKAPKGDKDPAKGFDIGMMFGGGQGLKDPEKVPLIQTFQAIFQINQRSTLSVEIAAYTGDGIGVYKRQVQMPIINPEEARPKVKGTTKLDVAPMARDYAQALEDGKKVDPFMSMIMSAQTGSIGAMSMMFGSEATLAESAGPPSQPLSPAIRALMEDPSKNEPLSFLLGPLLDHEASLGKNVVAIPSDDVFAVLAPQLTKRDSTIEGVLDAIDRSLTEKITQDGTWEILQASSPLELRSAHCKRDALTSLIKAGSSKGYVNLDDCAKFATAQDSARGSEILALPLITAVFRTSDLGSASALTNIGFDALKLYATLTDFQKQSLASKRPVALAALNPGQTNIISRMVYNSLMPPFKGADGVEQMFGTDTEEGGDMDGMMGLGMAIAGPMMSAFGMGDVTMDTERTILLPTGIPVVGSIRLKSMPMDSLMAIDDATGNKMITMPEMLGMMNSDAFSMVPALKNMKRSFSRYKLAKQTSHLLFFQLGKNASYFTTLYDVSVDNSKTYTKDQLPQKIQDRLKFEMPTGGAAPVAPPTVIPPR